MLLTLPATLDVFPRSAIGGDRHSLTLYLKIKDSISPRKKTSVETIEISSSWPQCSHPTSPKQINKRKTEAPAAPRRHTCRMPALTGAGAGRGGCICPGGAQREQPRSRGSSRRERRRCPRAPSSRTRAGSHVTRETSRHESHRGSPRIGGGEGAAVAMTTSRGRENFKSQPSVQERLPLKGARTHRHIHRGGLPSPPPPPRQWRWRRRGGGQPPALTARTTRSRDKRTRAEKGSRSAVTGGTQRPQAKP